MPRVPTRALRGKAVPMRDGGQSPAAASLGFLIGALLSLAFIVSLLAPHMRLVAP